ncbi:MAG TPA: histidinol dehydrogenase [bacterium]|nr:histidinol dehydrogenase [bacterium]
MREPRTRVMPEVQRLSGLSPRRRAELLERSAARLLDPSVRETAARALEAVRERGDDAVAAYTAAHDGVRLTPAELAVDGETIARARQAIPPAVLAALEAAIERARRYNEHLMPRSWLEPLEPGITVGIKFTPLSGVGVYVPSGKGTFPSTAVTLLTPAVVAGVEAIAVVVPPRRDGSVDPAILAACDLLGVRAVFRCNGVAGVAALAVGTERIPRMPALAGPGNPYVAATQLLAQAGGVRMLALLGPTEAVILADETADPRRVALDLVSEAEHGADSAALLVTDSPALAAAVAERIPILLDRLPEDRAGFARAAITANGGIFAAASMEEAIAFVNDYAPEHLLVVTVDPRRILERITHAGEILLGPSTPFAAANYAIGVPAALPTNGAARAASGITALSFLKASSVAMLDEAALGRLRPVVEQLGMYEGFPAHVRAVTDR